MIVWQQIWLYKVQAELKLNLEDNMSISVNNAQNANLYDCNINNDNKPVAKLDTVELPPHIEEIFNSGIGALPIIMSPGKSFDKFMGFKNPQADADTGSLDNYKGEGGIGAAKKFDFTAVPSLGATMMQFNVDFASEMRRQSSDKRAIETNMVVEQMESQAATIISKAATQMAMGIVSGTLSIAQGIASTAVVAKGSSSKTDSSATKPTDVPDIKTTSLKSDVGMDDDLSLGTEMKTFKVTEGPQTTAAAAEKAVPDGEQDISFVTDEMTDATKVAPSADKGAAGKSEAEINAEAAKATQLNLKAQNINIIMGALVKNIDASSDGAGSILDAQNKIKDKDIEMLKSLMASQESLEGALKDLVQKSLSTYEAMAESLNQTRTKIMG